MIFSFLCQKNRFDVNKKLQLYFEFEMAIFGASEQNNVQTSSNADETQNNEHPGEPINKFKVCSDIPLSHSIIQIFHEICTLTSRVFFFV